MSAAVLAYCVIVAALIVGCITILLAAGADRHIADPDDDGDFYDARCVHCRGRRSLGVYLVNVEAHAAEHQRLAALDPELLPRRLDEWQTAVDRIKRDRGNR